MYNIDARGRSCPEPVLMTKEILEGNEHDQIKVLVDAHVAVENITRYAENKGCTVKVIETGEDYEISINK